MTRKNQKGFRDLTADEVEEAYSRVFAGRPNLPVPRTPVSEAKIEESAEALFGDRDAYRKGSLLDPQATRKKVRQRIEESPERRGTRLSDEAVSEAYHRMFA